MGRKIGVILLLIALISGCFNDAGKETDTKKMTTDTNQNEQVQKSIITSDTPQDASIVITTISKPESIISEKSAEIRFTAGADTVENGVTTHYSSSDFLYNYSLSNDGGTTKISQYSLPDNTFVKTSFVSMSGLTTDKTYTFTIKAYNKKTQKVCKTPEVVTFQIVTPSVDTITNELLLTMVSIDKPLISPGENLKVSFVIFNNGAKDYVIKPFLNISDSTDTASKNWKFVSSDNPGIIKPGKTLTVSEVYTLTDSVLLDTGKDIDKTQEIRAKIKINDGGVAKETAENTSNKVVILMKDKIKLYIKYTSFSKETIVPGESRIVVTYGINNPTKKEMLVTSIVPTFTDALGKDVTSDWTDTTSTKTDVVAGDGSINTVTDCVRIYTLKATAASGDVFVDGIATATIAEDFGVVVKSSNAEKRDSVKVMSSGSLTLDAWISMPEGVKTDGTVYAGQEFTVYGIVRYDGELNFSDGEIELKIDELDSTAIELGDSKITIEKTMVNKILEWKIKAGSKPIQGNVRLKLNKAPIISLNDTTIPVKTANVEKIIPITVIDKPQMILENGMEVDNYGGIDGIVKANTDCKIYARVYNAGGGNVTGNVTIKINYKDSITDMMLAQGESDTKTVAIGSKAIWTLTTPLANRRGDISFTVIDIAKDSKTNIKPEVVDSKYRMSVVLGGDLSIARVMTNRETVKPGVSGIPIIFSIKNDGYGQVKITDINAVFTQNGVDVSSKWQKTGTLPNLGNTILDTINTDVKVMDITVYYTLKENMYDGSDLLGLVNITGNIKGMDLISDEVLSDDYPITNSQIEVLDIVPAVANAGKDFTAKVGVPVTFDGSKSTDNKAVSLYNWDFGDGKTSGGVMNPIHTYNTKGIYTVTLTVNDAANNGPSTAKIYVTVQ